MPNRLQSSELQQLKTGRDDKTHRRDHDRGASGDQGVVRTILAISLALVVVLFVVAYLLFH